MVNQGHHHLLLLIFFFTLFVSHNEAISESRQKKCQEAKIPHAKLIPLNSEKAYLVRCDFGYELSGSSKVFQCGRDKIYWTNSRCVENTGNAIKKFELTRKRSVKKERSIHKKLRSAKLRSRKSKNSFKKQQNNHKKPGIAFKKVKLRSRKSFKNVSKNGKISFLQQKKCQKAEIPHAKLIPLSSKKAYLVQCDSGYKLSGSPRVFHCGRDKIYRTNSRCVKKPGIVVKKAESTRRNGERGKKVKFSPPKENKTNVRKVRLENELAKKKLRKDRMLKDEPNEIYDENYDYEADYEDVDYDLENEDEEYDVGQDDNEDYGDYYDYEYRGPQFYCNHLKLKLIQI